MLGRLAAAILMTTAVLAPAAAADWPSFHNDTKKSGNVPFSTYPVYKDVWWNNKTLANAPIHASPVVKDNILVTADLGGLVRALDASSGKQLWSWKMPQPVESTPAIGDDGRVYVLSVDGTIDALDLKTGARPGSTPPAPWATAAVGSTHSSPTYNSGSLFVGNDAGEMRSYHASDLLLLWTFQVASITQSSTTDKNGVTTCTGGSLPGGAVYASPAIFDGKVFFGSTNTYVYAVDEAGGQGTRPDGSNRPPTETKVEWVAQTGDRIFSSPAINTRAGEPDRVIFTSYDGKAYSFEASPGSAGEDPCNGLVASPDWTYEVPTIQDPETGETQVSKIESSPAAAGSRIFFGANNGNVYGVDSADGSLLWETPAGGVGHAVTSSPAVANGIVVVGSEDKNVYWINATDGKVLKKFATQSKVVTSPAIDADRAFVAEENGILYMFGPTIPTRPDLVVTGISALGTSLQVTVKNQGDAASAATHLRIYVGGTFLTNQTVPALNASQSTTLTYAANLGASSVSVRAVVDPVANESNSANNEMTQGVAAQLPATTAAGGGSSGKKGIKLPGPGLPAILGLLAVAALAARRRR
jgi:outer membrane protein assembly factor BamB